MNELRENQLNFARHITAPDIIKGGSETFSNSIRANGLTGERRLNLYRNGVSLGYAEVLKDVFGVVEKLIGEDCFSQVATAYVHEHPSYTGNVHDYGADFPAYLASAPGIESVPYVPDVARLEWIYHSAFHSPAGEVLNIEKLSQVPESKYDNLHLLFSPVCHLFSSEYPALHIWQTNQDDYTGDDVVDLDEGGQQLAIIREGKQIAFHPLEPAAYAMLDAMSRGENINRACELAAQINSDCDVGRVLQDAVLNRMIVGFTVKE